MERWYAAAVVVILPLGAFSVVAMLGAVLLDKANSSWAAVVLSSAICAGSLSLAGTIATAKMWTQPYARRVLNTRPRKVWSGLAAFTSTGAVMSTMTLYLILFGN